MVSTDRKKPRGFSMQFCVWFLWTERGLVVGRGLTSGLLFTCCRSSITAVDGSISREKNKNTFCRRERGENALCGEAHKMCLYFSLFSSSSASYDGRPTSSVEYSVLRSKKLSRSRYCCFLVFVVTSVTLVVSRYYYL